MAVIAKFTKTALPTDLEGLLRETYTPSRSADATPDLRSALASIRRRVASLGSALRTGYNEISALMQTLEEREIEFSNAPAESLKDIVQRAARGRKRPWYAATGVSQLTDEVEKHYDGDTVDLVFWWLIVYGVITFNNVNEWSSDGTWYYEDSVQYAEFTDRGVVLLNELKPRPRKR